MTESVGKSETRLDEKKKKKNDVNTTKEDGRHRATTPVKG